jgi:tetraacyldisaccharide 4'-kinase
VSADRLLQQVWYRRAPFALFVALLPLSWLFGAVAAVRRALFKLGLLRVVKVERPVLVVGNVTVGGTGKTPLVIWLAERLATLGAKVGIITRGYGGRSAQWPLDVTRSSSAEEAGDEAVLLALRSDAIVVAGPDRVAAARRAIERGATVIVSDDGLQHYGLGRDAEIVVIDAERRFGNGWLLPAGPLREKAKRANLADLIVETVRGEPDAAQGAASVRSVQDLCEAINLSTGERRPLESFRGQRVHGVAAIGHPDAFFAMLARHGIDLERHPLPDHARLSAREICFDDGNPVLMTEKDAVKCRAFVDARHWAVPLAVTFSAADVRRFDELLVRLVSQSRSIETAGGSP